MGHELKFDLSTTSGYQRYLYSKGYNLYIKDHEEYVYADRYVEKLKQLQISGYTLSKLKEIFGDNELRLFSVQLRIGDLPVVAYEYRDKGWLSSSIFQVHVVFDPHVTYTQKMNFESLYGQAIICEVWEEKEGYLHSSTLPSLRFIKGNVVASLDYS